MGNRRKSWYIALMEGTQTLMFFCTVILIILLVDSLINNFDAYEYFYLVGLVFIICALISYRYTYIKVKKIAHNMINKLFKNNQ